MKPFPKIPHCKLYLCGGCVRDTLLGIEPKDRDFVVITDCTFSEVEAIINEQPNMKVWLAKPEFFTIRCQIDGENIDIAFPRDENSYTDNRHPDNVTRVDSLEEDAKRRDFTINAMYMDEDGKIIDYFGGQKDLKDGWIKCVENPHDRFQEDALRILRAMRFAIKLDFGIELQTHYAMRDCIKLLNNISMERIKEELNKCLLINPKSTFNSINFFNLWKFLGEKGLTFELTNRER